MKQLSAIYPSIYQAGRKDQTRNVGAKQRDANTKGIIAAIPLYIPTSSFQGAV